MALILILGLPIGTTIALQFFLVARKSIKGTLLQMINFLCIPLSIFSIVLTGSRTSLIAIIPFILYLMTTHLITIDRKIFILVTLLVSLFVLLPFVPPSVINRLGTIGTSISERDLGGRVNLWMASIAALAEHPLLGVGSGAMDYTIGAWVHNTFLSVASETGFIGFILFLSILGLVIYKLVMLPRRAFELWLTILITWTIGILSLSWESRKITWLLLSFIIIESGFREQSIEPEKKIDLAGSIKPSLKQVKHA
jgi:O-antigen ligase